VEMGIGEIEVTYRQAKNKEEQLKILADRNLCTVDEIKAVLISTGKYVDRGENGLCMAVMPKPRTDLQPSRAEQQKEENVMDWKTAISVINSTITQLISTKSKADSELAEIMLALGNIGKEE